MGRPSCDSVLEDDLQMGRHVCRAAWRLGDESTVGQCTYQLRRVGQPRRGERDDPVCLWVMDALWIGAYVCNQAAAAAPAGRPAPPPPCPSPCFVEVSGHLASRQPDAPLREVEPLLGGARRKLWVIDLDPHLLKDAQSSFFDGFQFGRPQEGRAGKP